MRKFFTLLVCFFLFISFVQAQQYSKLGSYLSEHLKRVEFAQSDKRQALLVKGNPEDIRRAVEQYQGIFKFNAKNVCSIEIPYKNLKAFSEEKCVERIENSFGPGQLLMDTARVNNNIDKVHSGIAPLIQSYSGKNVVVGIIDGGIYFPHGDFRKVTGLTRIRNLWDQKGTGTAPVPSTMVQIGIQQLLITELVRTFRLRAIRDMVRMWQELQQGTDWAPQQLH